MTEPRKVGPAGTPAGSFTHRLRTVLADEGGNALVDAMVGAVIVAVVVTASVGSFFFMNQAAATAGDNAARSIALRSHLSSIMPKAGAYTSTPTVEATMVDDLDGVTVHAWVESPSEWESYVYVTAPKVHAPEGTECVTSTNTDCLVEVLPVDRSVGGVALPTLPVVPVASGYTVNIPNGSTEVRYVVAVTTPPTVDTTIALKSGDMSSAFTVPAGKAGYYYGGLDVSTVPGTSRTLLVEVPPNITVDESRTLFYEAPVEAP